MTIIIRILNKYLIVNILTIVTIILLVNINVQKTSIGFYNKIIESKLENYLSVEGASLIITTVSGDQKYQTNSLEDLYKKLNILHLLVLSGSNIGIFNLFISVYKVKNRLSYFVLYVSLLICYLSYVNFIHPLARATIFMIIYEYVESNGLKHSDTALLLFLICAAFLGYVTLNFSISFLISIIFSLFVILFNIITKSHLRRFNTLVLKFVVFPIFMTVGTAPIHLYFFGEYNFRSLLVSNILITPYYDVFTFIIYLTYILTLFSDFVPDLFRFLTYFTSLLLSTLYYLSNFSFVYNN